MKPHRDLEHGVPVLPSGYYLSCPSWLESVTGFVFSIYVQPLLIAHSLANLVLVWHMLSPNPEVPDQSLLLRLPLASANSRPTPRSDSNHLGKLRKANTRAVAPQQHRMTRGIKACVVQEELKDCVFVSLTRESGPTASSLYLSHNWSPASTPQSREEQWGGTYLSNVFLPFLPLGPLSILLLPVWERIRFTILSSTLYCC